LGDRDVAVLPLLGPAAEQNHDSVALLAEVDAIAWPEIDAVLEDAGTHALYVREVAQLQSPNRGGHFRGCDSVECLKPLGEGSQPDAVEVLEDRQHYMVTQKAPIQDGVYTAAQAQRGRVAYDANCATCHGADCRSMILPNASALRCR
jgi:cytochrome c553